jgi:hypothetical protein
MGLPGPGSGYERGVPHFGETLRRLRTARGLTQSTLAERAGVSLSTVQQGEGQERCTWRRRNVTDVFEALNRVAPVPEADAADYFEAAGMTALVEVAKRAASEAYADLRARDFNLEAQTAHLWVERLIDERGGTNVLTALEALAAAWSIDLPPRLKYGQPGPRWVEYAYESEGLRVREFIPTNRPPPTSPPAGRKGADGG